MRHISSLSLMLAIFVAFVACKSTEPPAPVTQPNQSASPPQPTSPATPSSASTDTRQQPPHPPTISKNNPQIAQLNLDTEGGTRDGSYAMWVHVSEDGKPVPHLRVLAYNSANRIAAAAQTNDDGDARLLVQIAGYRIVAAHGRRRAEQSVAYHPGSQFELQLAR